MRRAKKGFICFVCDKRYHELEDAEVCEQSHGKQAIREREKHEDDGREYGDPRDFRDGLE